MKVTLTRDTLVEGNGVSAGTTVDVLDKHGRYLIGAGKAIPYETPRHVEAKPLDRMNKAELLAEAAERGLDLTEDDTNAQIREAIAAHDGAES